jgi:hypothetical protein
MAIVDRSRFLRRAGWCRLLHMTKRWVGTFLVVVVVLSCLVSTASADNDPIEVCWKPPGLPPGIDTFVILKTMKGDEWVLVGNAQFPAAVRFSQAYKYNPNLDHESLDKIPGKQRPRSCTPRPAEKPEAGAAKAPAAPPAPAPKPQPAAQGGTGSGKTTGGEGKSAGKDVVEADGTEPEAKNPQPTYSRPPSDEYEEFRKRRAKYKSNLPDKTEYALPRNVSTLPPQQERPVVPKLVVSEEPQPVLTVAPPMRSAAAGCTVTPPACASPPGIVQASESSGGVRDCDQEQIDCFRRCWASKPPWPIKKGKAGHYGYCQTKCLGEYMECLAEEGLRRTFEAMAEAAAWLKRHPGIAVGTIIVIGGIVYVVSTGGAGALVLIPLGA